MNILTTTNPSHTAKPVTLARIIASLHYASEGLFHEALRRHAQVIGFAFYAWQAIRPGDGGPPSCDAHGVRRPLPLFALLISPLAVLGCGGSQHSTLSSSTQVSVSTLIVFNQEPERLPFDPRSARLRAATEQLTVAAGHPVTWELDVALLPQYRASFEDSLIASIEVAARDFDYLRTRKPDLFTHGAPLVNKIVCRYDAVARRPKSILDPANRLVRIDVPSNAATFIYSGAIVDPVEDEYEQYLDQRYAGRAPEAVPASELATYFEYLDRNSLLRRRNESRERPGLLSDGNSNTLLRKFRVGELARDATLKARVDAELVSASGEFVSAYLHHPDVTRSLPSDAPFHRAERAFAAWVKTSFDRLKTEQRLTLLKNIFARPFQSNRGLSAFVEFAFPGIDPFALGLRVVDEWIRSGHPLSASDDPKATELYEWIVCPYVVNERGTRSLVPRCDHQWYRYAVDDAAKVRRLIEVLLERGDPQLTEYTIVNLSRLDAMPYLVEVWRGLEPDIASWRIATHVIADELADSRAPEILDEAFRLWRLYPVRRGPLLYLLAQFDRYGNGAVPWSTFEEKTGGLISQGEFTSFLDEGGRALANAWVTWPALGRGWSRSDPFVRKLDRYVDDPVARYYGQGEPYGAVSHVVGALCRERAAGDLAILNRWMSARVRAHPSDDRAYANLITETAPAGCARRLR